MASWMVHLRIADKLLDQIPGLSPTAFIMGNMAPDSGVPNEDWSTFTPSTTISHFRTREKKADPDAYAARYFSKEQQLTYNTDAFSFYLGYLTHLMADVLWSQKIVLPALNKHAEIASADRKKLIWEFKKDWYDLDFKFLHEHPGFRAFKLYLQLEGFRNIYMEEFSEVAFDDRRRYITGFYLQNRDGLNREYPYLSEHEMNAFVETAVQDILLQLKHF